MAAPKGTLLLRSNEMDGRVWTYDGHGVPGALRLFSVEKLLQPGSCQIELYEWVGLDSWVSPQDSSERDRDAPPGMPGYAAISHVWDPSDEVVRMSREANRPLRIDTGNSTAHMISWHGLTQAAIAAKKLSCEYLWLDLLCLDQRSRSDKKLQIKNMHNIYRSATGVLVMFGGVAAAQGLDKPSTWINRAWTLQEASLCRHTYGLVDWPLAVSFYRGYPEARFDKLDGDLAIVDLGGLLDTEPGATLGRGTCFGNRGIVRNIDVDIEFHCLGKESAAISALASVVQLSRSHDGDPEALHGAAWRSMWLRTSSKPQDLVFSFMHLLGADIEVDYNRSLDDLIFELITKTTSIPGWLTIGYDIPINPRSGLIPQIPIFTSHSIPIYQIDGQAQSASKFVISDYLYKNFDIAVKSSSVTDGHLVCAQMLDVQSSSKPVWSRADSSYRESELLLSSPTYKLKATCQFKGQMGTILVVVGERQEGKTMVRSAITLGMPLIYLLAKNKRGVWQKVGAGTIDEALISKRHIGRVQRRHLRVGGAPGAEGSPCDCERRTEVFHKDLLKVYAKAEGGEFGTALQAASTDGNEGIVRLLIKNGADVNAQGEGFYGNALQAACCNGREEVARLLIEAGANVNAKGSKFCNALHAALDGDHERVVQLLIQKGANMNEIEEHIGTALHKAVMSSSELTVELLLNNGANINALGGLYGSALQTACSNDKLRVARLLIQRGADVNAGGGYYGSALQAAARYGAVEIAQLLIERGAKVNFYGGEYGYALQAACYTDQDQVADLLIKKGANVNAQGGKYGNALHAACRCSAVNTARLLIKHGANVNAKRGDYGDEEERKYDNPLQAAAALYNLDLIRLLVDNNADVNAQGGLYGTALMTACYYCQELTALELVKCGANVNARGGYYGTALQASVVATYGMNLPVAWMLIENGADVNMQGGYYGNALQAACYNGISSAVTMLIENGADVNARGGKYGSALQAASHCGHGEIVRLLLAKGADNNVEDAYREAFLESYSDHYEHVIQRLIAKGADVNATDDGRYGTVLQAASQCEDQEVVRLLAGNGSDIYLRQRATFGEHAKVVLMLIENGADVNALAGRYGNALQAASYEGNKDVMRVLITNGANVNAQGGKFGTALQAAATRGYELVVRLLLENGAEVNSGGGLYGSPLAAAVQNNNHSVIEILQEHGARV